LTFAPDHASDYYSDGVHVELFNMEEAYSFQVTGQAKEHIMYVAGGRLMHPSVESLLPMVTLEPDEGIKSVKLLLICSQSFLVDFCYIYCNFNY